ncbi:hypothetical protein PGT21_008499 [Puccinia graminis f. sp. tritici]|uniref:RlpA-like protein double-psi beta-barrel domain-containing protein n=1 Tax=Puccinia graminis f. sp. tritici TaxID=56615 RepID=A0A5B0N596_PUCGR|nr:hypothetical protein PGTUg99_028693 [Puccinia graminis f. sp. tritici]KAA1083836.1 hypothetical protein PGT21_008499 [Puccinia graminis f. sp. tritici]
MKSSTITLAVTLVLSSSSSISGMPYYLDSLPDVSLSARAPAYLIKRSLFDGESPDHYNALLKRENEKKKSSYSSSKDDQTGDNGDEEEEDDDDDDCDDSSDDEVQDPTNQHYKIGRNATGARAPSSSSPSNSYKSPSGHPSALVNPTAEKKPSNTKFEISKQSSKPSVAPLKAEKHVSHKESSSSQSYSFSSSHVHYGGSGGEPEVSGSSYHGKATFYSQDGNPGACGQTHQDTDFIVAIQSQMYGGGKFCGKTVIVTRKSTGQSIKCIAADECPGCPTGQSLDLSQAAFNALGQPQEGVFDIEWKLAEDN